MSLPSRGETGLALLGIGVFFTKDKDFTFRVAARHEAANLKLQQVVNMIAYFMIPRGLLFCIAILLSYVVFY